MGQQVIQFAVTIVLARILVPEDFGLVTMLAVFVAVGQAITDCGFGAALIQRREVSYVDECSVFYFNIVVGVICAGALFGIAPYIAKFYGDTRLIGLARAFSVSLVVGSFGIVHASLLMKSVDFRTQAKISVFATLAAGFISIALAFLGFGVWSLVSLYIVGACFRCILLWIAVSWRPSIVVSLSSLRAMFPYGSRLLISSLLETLFANVYTLVIGRVSSATELGYYARAQELQLLPIANVCAALGRVVFPVFSEMSTDLARLKIAVRRSMRILTCICFPVTVGVAVLADVIIRVVYGQQWLASVLYLQLLCVTGLFYPIHVVNLNVLKSLGRADLYLRVELVKKALVVVTLFVTYRYGVTVMIIGQIVNTIFAFVVNGYYVSQLVKYTWWEQGLDTLSALWVSCVMGGAVVAFSLLVRGDGPLQLVVLVGFGMCIYVLLCEVVRLSAYQEVKRHVANIMRKSVG